MITYENKNKFKDRNGLDLEYGDKVLVKYGGIHHTIGIATIIGFTEKYVVLIWTPGSGSNFCRIPNNVIKITNPDKWKFWI